MRRNLALRVPIRLSSRQILRSEEPTIYTVSPLEPVVGIAKYASEANLLFSTPCKYLSPKELGYALPSQNIPEFAFIGRSNVGKSSLIDVLLSERGLVRISKEPGCTRTINYFGFIKKGSTQSPTMYIIDLPGYGYAKVSKESRSQWKNITEGYFKSREFTTLRRVYVLVDSRHGIKESDREVFDMLNTCHLPYQIILTKSDLCDSSTLVKTLKSAFDDVMDSPLRHHCMPFIHVVSSRKSYGIDALKQSMTEIFLQDIGVEKGIQNSKSVFDDMDEETLMSSLSSLGVDLSDDERR